MIAEDRSRPHGSNPRKPVDLTLTINGRTRRLDVNTNLADYRVPVNADVAEVEVILVPEEDREVNPAGVKGLGGFLANVGTAAAVANAIYHATGIRVRALPIRIEKLLTA